MAKDTFGDGGFKTNSGSQASDHAGLQSTFRPSGIFLSTYEKDIDSKGRVGLPLEFRNVLISSAHSLASVGGVTYPISYGFVAFRSYLYGAIECFTLERMEKLSAKMDTLDPFSMENDAFGASVFADSHFIGFDPNEGRAKIPSLLLEHAGIEKSMVFVGKGATFQIWNAKAFSAHQEKARKALLEKQQQNSTL